MRIEKVNENQIRCTLTKQDLAERQINLNELAYGTEKARDLFDDMIEQANYEFGFDASDNPLMVEAIPLSAESLVLLITKVDYPDELDTHFSQFTDGGEGEAYHGTTAGMTEKKSASDIVDLYKKIKNAKEAATAAAEESARVEIPEDLARLFEFDDMQQLERASRVLAEFYNGRSELYKNEKKHGKHGFFLLIHKDSHTPEEFNKVCNILCEYGIQWDYTPALGAYLEEHGKRITGPRAVQTIASL